ncbi:MAG: immunoglobulin domain-containing protein [Verrucomicrobiota bacterium]|jgi:hypothetical protein
MRIVQYSPESIERQNLLADSRGVVGRRENDSKNQKNLMNKRIPYIITLAAVTGLILIAGNTAQAQMTDPLLTDPVDQSGFPQITAQPLDQAVPIGSNVVLSVQAINADSYQWLCNGVPIDGQTNSILVIANVGTNDVGLYSCEVFNGDQAVPTRMASVEAVATGNGAASVNAVTTASVTTSANVVMASGLLGGGPIIVFGTPLSGGGRQGTCPGPYAGVVAYTKTVSQGWGWAPITGATVLTAADGSGRTDTKVQYLGAYGDNGCAQTTVTIPYPPISPVYRFAIYFTNNVPTNAYPIVLTGFNQ